MTIEEMESIKQHVYGKILLSSRICYFDLWTLRQTNFLLGPGNLHT
eukprot:UN17784